MAATATRRIQYIPGGIYRKGDYRVTINGAERGWVERTADGLWQAWVFARGGSVKVGVPQVTRREAGAEVDIEWEHWN